MAPAPPSVHTREHNALALDAPPFELWARKGLVVFQFTVSVFLILASLVIWRQLDFLTHQDLGFQKDQQLVIPLRTAESTANFEALRQKASSNAGVLSAAGGTTYPGQTPSNDLRFYTDGQTIADGTNIPFGRIGYDYLQTLGMTITHGHAFSKDFPSDSAGIIFNETAIRKLGLDPATAVGTVSARVGVVAGAGESVVARVTFVILEPPGSAGSKPDS